MTDPHAHHHGHHHSAPRAAPDAHAGHDMHRGHAPPAHAPPERRAEAHDAHAGHVGHDKHSGHSVEMFRTKFWISLALTLPTLIWGHMLQGALGYTAPHFPGTMWIPPAFGVAVFAYGGWVFIQGTIRELRARLPGMMTLIALAISVAFVFSGGDRNRGAYGARRNHASGSSKPRARALVRKRWPIARRSSSHSWR